MTRKAFEDFCKYGELRFSFNGMKIRVDINEEHEDKAATPALKPKGLLGE